MLGFNLQKWMLCVTPAFFLSAQILAQEKIDSSSSSNVLTNSSASAEDKSKTVDTIEAIKKASGLHPRVIVSTGMGFIRAFRLVNKENLGANGIADVKVSILANERSRDNKKFYITLRYFPFSIGPSSITPGVNQEYSGVISAYSIGAEANLLTVKRFQFLASLEVGAFHSQLTELIPTKESDRPVRRSGGIVAAGGEIRYKAMERFQIGPRICFGAGSISFLSMLLSASFTF